MLETTKKLQVGFRAHVKTHKVFYLSYLSTLFQHVFAENDGDGDADG